MIVISSGMVLAEADLAIPLSHPRLLYENLFRDGTVTVSGEESAEFAAENATLDPATWNFWRADALPATLRVALETSKPANCCLVAAHTLGTDRAPFTLEYHDGTSWVTIAETLRGNDNVFAILFEDIAASQWGIGVAGDTVPSVGVVMIGKALALPRGVSLDHGPVSLSARTVIEPNISEGGQWLGRSIRRQGVETEISLRHLPSDFVYRDLAPFIAEARPRPFGWLWAPQDRPADVAYCWTDDDIRPAPAGLPDRMDVTFGVAGLME